MRVSYYFVALVLLMGAGAMKDWYYLAVISMAIVLGIADQFIEAIKTRTINVNVKLPVIEVKSGMNKGSE